MVAGEGGEAMTAQPIVEVCVQGYETDNRQPNCKLVFCGLQHVKTQAEFGVFMRQCYEALDKFDTRYREEMKQRRGHRAAK